MWKALNDRAFLKKNAGKGAFRSWLFITFARGRGFGSAKTCEKKTRRYVLLALENVGNFQFECKNSVMALTLWRGLLLLHLYSKVSYDLQAKDCGIAVPRFRFKVNVLVAAGGHKEN